MIHGKLFMTKVASQWLPSQQITLGQKLLSAGKSLYTSLNLLQEKFPKSGSPHGFRNHPSPVTTHTSSPSTTSHPSPHQSLKVDPFLRKLSVPRKQLTQSSSRFLPHKSLADYKPRPLLKGAPCPSTFMLFMCMYMYNVHKISLI